MNPTPVAEPRAPQEAAPAARRRRTARQAPPPAARRTKAARTEGQPAADSLVRPADEGFPLPFVTRKTPVVLMLRIAAAAFLLEAAYVFAQVMLPQGTFVDNPLAFVIVFGTQIAVAAYFFLDWFMETYEVHKEDIHHNRGILFRREETYPYNNMQSITCNQSPLGRIFHYGEVRVFVPTLGDELAFEQVPHPHHFIATVRHILPYPDQHRFILHG